MAFKSSGRPNSRNNSSSTQKPVSQTKFGSAGAGTVTVAGDTKRASGSAVGINTLKRENQFRTSGDATQLVRNKQKQQAQKAVIDSVPNTTLTPSRKLIDNTGTTNQKTIINNNQTVINNGNLNRPSYPNPFIYQQPTFWDNVKTAATYTVVSNLTNRAVNGVIDSFTGKHGGNRNNVVASETTVQGQQVYKLEDKQTGVSEFYVADAQGKLIPQTEAQRTTVIIQQNKDDNRFDLAWKTALTATTLAGGVAALKAPTTLGKVIGLGVLGASVLGLAH
jgi:hypothetical protein